jgi:hypothetical protein
MFSMQLDPSTKFVMSKVLFLCLCPWVLSVASLHAKEAPNVGVAWQVLGTWQVAGEATPIRIGNAIQPTSLLQPAGKSGNHSITVLLPDGQRILYECFTEADCARGFRVPSLIKKPDSFAVDMLARIRTVLTGKHYDLADGLRTSGASQAPRDETVAVLDAHNRVHLTGLLTALPKGHYTYDLRPLDHGRQPQYHLVIEKAARSIDLPLPAPGLYLVTIGDASNTPRIDLFLAAISPEQSSDFQRFQYAKTTMEKWNDDYAGWPIDDFLRAYLESLMRSEQASLTAEGR